MAACGERYWVSLACECGTKGAAEYEDHVPSASRELRSVRGAFTVSGGSEQEIVCACCQAKVS
jgi:hypothetical protein